MKRLLLISLLIFAAAGLLQAEYPLLWKTNKFSDPANDICRGLVYNPDTDHVLVVTRKGGVHIYILDAASGDSLGEMNSAGIGGGTYAINLIARADDGTLYVCNLSAPVYSPGSKFKVYRYAGERPFWRFVCSGRTRRRQISLQLRSGQPPHCGAQGHGGIKPDF